MKNDWCLALTFHLVPPPPPLSRHTTCLVVFPSFILSSNSVSWSSTIPQSPNYVLPEYHFKCKVKANEEYYRHILYENHNREWDSLWTHSGSYMDLCYTSTAEWRSGENIPPPLISSDIFVLSTSMSTAISPFFHCHGQSHHLLPPVLLWHWYKHLPFSQIWYYP